MSNSEEEEIARDYICFGNPDATVVVVDGTCLERNLNLVFQIMEITDNVIVCVNLLDEAKKKKIKIDLKMLSDLLGVPVVGTVARKKKTLDSLMDTILQVCKKNIKPAPKKLEYSPIIEEAIIDFSNELKTVFTVSENLYRWIALKILDGEKTIIDSIEKNLNVDIQDNEFIQQKKQKILDNFNTKDINSANFKDKIVSSIMNAAETICKKVCTFENKNYSRKR